MTDGQSDSFVLLGGGKADYMGKGRAEQSHEQSTHAKEKSVPQRSVSRTLLELKDKARRKPKYRFRSLCTEINKVMLYDSFRLLKRRAAPGVDGVTMTDYEERLEEHIEDLHERLLSKLENRL